jgi:hypothetical protein
MTAKTYVDGCVSAVDSVADIPRNVGAHTSLDCQALQPVRFHERVGRGAGFFEGV